MTTLAPVLDLVGDVGSYSVFNYNGDVWVAYIRHSGELEIHRSGDPIDAFIDADVPYPKNQISVVVVGGELLIFWVETTTSTLYLSKWHLGLRWYTQMPTPKWVGSSPSLAISATTKLILSYVDPAGQHVYRTSDDWGDNWNTSTVVDNEEVVREVDVNVYPPSSFDVFWAETSEESV